MFTILVLIILLVILHMTIYAEIEYQQYTKMCNKPFFPIIYYFETGIQI